MYKRMDHGAYMKKVKKMTYNELLYTARDAKAAAEAYPEGPNAGYYLDEVNYCAEEMFRRDKLLKNLT